MSDHSLLNLPVELLARIGRFLSFPERLRLASANSRLRQIYVPELFFGLRITNREEDLEAIYHVVAQHGQFVRKLRFQCHLYGNPPDTAYVIHDHCGHVHVPEFNRFSAEELCTLPSLIARLLSGETLAQLQAITVEFLPKDDFETGVWGDEPAFGSIYIHSELESEVEIAQREASSPWRKVLTQVWEAVSANMAVCSLEILNLPPRETSTWGTTGWTLFLAGLRRLSIEVWGGDNGAGWRSSTTDGYLDFLSRMDEYFFRHTAGLVYLKIVANPLNGYGCTGMRHAPLALRPHHMTALSTLELHNCTIDPNLVEFLATHSETLRHLAMIECNSCAADGLTTDEVSWADLFNVLHANKPRLESLVVSNASIPLSLGEIGAGPEAYDTEGNLVSHDHDSDGVKAIRKSIRSGSEKIFSYCYVSDKYGGIIDMVEENRFRFEAGHDRRAYGRLTLLIEQNSSPQK